MPFFLARMVFSMAAAMRVFVARPARRLLLEARRLDTAERSAKFVNFPFVGQFLAFGQLDQFKNFVQLVNRVLERFRNFRGMSHSLADGRRLRRAKIRWLDPGFRLRAAVLWTRRAFLAFLALWTAFTLTLTFWLLHRRHFCRRLRSGL
jgi:hypothetical protein